MSFYEGRELVWRRVCHAAWRSEQLSLGVWSFLRPTTLGYVGFRVCLGCSVCLGLSGFKVIVSPTNSYTTSLAPNEGEVR